MTKIAGSPFATLRARIAQLNFACDPVYIPDYQRALSNVLGRLDRYFTQQQLYQAVDYWPIIANLQDWRFIVGPHENQNNQLKGETNPRQKTIMLAQSVMGQGVYTEGILCHEMIHYLTIGQNCLQYQQDGKKTKFLLEPINEKYSRAWLSTQRPHDLAHKQLAYQPVAANFLCEGFTEALKQAIYRPQECPPEYVPEVCMVRYLNRLTNGRTNLIDFLRRNFTNLGQILGSQGFTALQDTAELFSADIKKHPQHYVYFRSNPYYRRLQDIVNQHVLTRMQQNPRQWNEKTFAHIAQTMLMEAPARAHGQLMPERYRPALNAVAQALSQQRTTSLAAQQQYYAHLQNSLAQLTSMAHAVRISHRVITQPAAVAALMRE